MKIELQVDSPDVKLDGIDRALAKLEQMEDALLRLRQMKSLEFQVKVSAPGLNKLRTDLAGLEANSKTLAAALEAAGQTEMGAKISAGAMSAKDALEAIRIQATKVGDALSVNTAKTLEWRQQLGAMKERNVGFVGEADKEAEALKKIGAKEEATRQLAAQYAALQRAQGLAQAMSASKPINETAIAEEQLAESQAAAIAGMKLQGEIAGLKAKQMASLKTQVEATEEAEKKLDTATAKTTATMTKASAAGGLLSERYRSVEGGGEELVQRRHRGGAGEVITTEKEGRVTRDISELDKLREAVARVERESANSMLRAQTDWEKIIALENKAGQMRAVLTKTSLQNEPYVQQKLAQAANLQRSAEDLAKSAQTKSQREGEIAQLDRYKTAAQNIRLMMREDRAAGVIPDIDSYKIEAKALDQLRTSIGLTNREAETFKRQLESQAAMVRNQATELERLAVERAAMAQRRISEFEKTRQLWGGANPDRKISDTPTGSRETLSMAREVNGMRESVRMVTDFDHAGHALNGTLSTMSTQIEQVEKTTRGYGRTLLNGIGSFAGFVVASSVVYGSLQLIGKGFHDVVENGKQLAILRTVFNGTDEQVLRLRDSVESLAVFYGRSSQEAMDAAVRWSRMGLGAAQTAEAISISLEAANVAEITAAESAEQLAAIYNAFGLTISGVRVALNEMNTVSNTTNATVKDLMGGMQRVSGLAKQAGLSVAETIGIIGAAVSRTGRSGSEMGNALKAMIAAVSKPELQDFLKKEFKISIKTESGDIKDFSRVLNELFVTYQKLTDAERQELLVKVGGKQQASRFAAILDGYVKSQRLAIEAQLDLNSADRENQNIRATLFSQMQSMATMFEKLSIDMANAGGSFSLSAGFTEFIKLLGHAMGVLDKAPVVLGVLVTLMATLAARTLLSAASMQDGSVKANYLTSTLKQLAGVQEALGAAVDSANAKLLMQDGLLARAAAGAMGVSSQRGAILRGMARGRLSPEQGAEQMGAAAASVGTMGRSLGFLIGSLTAIVRLATGMVVIGMVMWGINKAFDYFQGDAEKARQKLAGFNEELERLRANSQANQMRSRLAGTLAESIGNIAARNPAGARAALGDFAAVSAPGNPGQQGAIREQLQGLLEQNRMAELQARLGGMRLSMQREFEESKRRELIASRAVQENLQRQIATENSLLPALSGGKREAAAKHIAELETQAAGELQRQAQAIDQIVEEEGQRTEEETKRQKLNKDMAKTRIDTVDKLQDAMPRMEGDRADWESRRQANQTNIEQTKQRITLLDTENQRLAHNGQSHLDSMEAQADKLREIALLRQRGMDMARTFVTPMGFGEFLTHPQNVPGNIEEMRRAQLARRGGMSDVNSANAQAKALGFEDAKELSGSLAIAEKAIEAARLRVGAAMNLNDEQKKVAVASLDDLQVQRKILAAEKDRAEYLEQIHAAKRDVKNEGLAAQIGANEGERLVSEFNAMNPLGGNADKGFMDRATTGRSIDGVDYKDQAKLLEQSRRMEDLINLAVERRNKLVAEGINLRRQEQEEASKALMTASREEQLRAAGTARLLDKRGGRGFSSSEFEFLDKSSQEAITKFNPNAAPRELQGGAQKADAERAKLDGSIEKMREVLDTTASFIKSFVNPVAPPPAPIDGRPEAPQIGPINITMGDQFAPLVDKLTFVVTNQVRIIEAKVDSFLAAQNIAAAQTASQGIA